MANAVLAFPNYADVDYYSPTISGGSWHPDAPLSNLQNRFFAYKARTVNCTTEATQFIVDLSTVQAVQVVAMPRHNMSLNATVKYTFYRSDMSIVYTATKAVYKQTYPYGSVPFESPNFWTGKMTPEQATIFPMPAHLILDTAIVCRYVKVEITDTDNTAGYIEIARIIIAPGWQPTINFSLGAKLSVRDETLVTSTIGGADFYDVRQKRRIGSLSFQYLPKDEAFVQAFDGLLRLGLKGQLYFCYDPDDDANLHRFSFVATMETLDGLTATLCGYSGIGYALKEVIS